MNIKELSLFLKVVTFFLSNIKYDEKMLSINPIVEEFDITKEDAEKTIQYLNDYIQNKKMA